MREDLWEFDPTHTVIVAANHKPEVRGTDKGIWRRIKIVPWEVSIPDSERDPKLPDKLERELEGILAWCVQGALAWQREGLAEPGEVTFQTEEYQKEQDVLAHFIYDECVEGPEFTVKSDPFYNRYREWCDRAGEFKLTQTKFSTRLKERGYEKKRSNQGMVWFCIALKGGGGPDGAGLDPTPRAGLTPNPTPPETRIDKPNADDGVEACRVDPPKSGSTPQKNPRVEVLTGKTLHDPTHPTQPYTLLDSDTSVEEAARRRRASR
jgi:phage/plasmid-associated DNA primase